MSDDGADMGVSAERALDMVFGGKEQPRDDEKMDPVQFEAWIKSHTRDPHTYGGTAAYAAKLILDQFRAHPEYVQLPLDDEYDETTWKPLGKPNLSSVMFAVPEFAALDLTGFMWGWAVNAARRCCELPSVPNPAIVTVG